MKPRPPRKLDDIARARISSWRRNARMTQKELGVLCGRNAVWISRYENGYFDSDLDTLQRMADAFGQTIFATLDQKADPSERDVIDAYRAIPRASARAMARALLLELAGPTRAGATEPAPAPPTAKSRGSKPEGPTTRR